MATPAQDKYFLRTLHQEIDLFDRKLAHMLRYDSFVNEAERKASAGKLVAKREVLAKTARRLVAEGIEFKDSELPRSFRSEELTAAAAEPTDRAATAQELPKTPQESREKAPFPSPYAGTIFDVQADVQAYKRNRSSKIARPQA